MARRTNTPQGPHVVPKVGRRDIAAARQQESPRTRVRCSGCGRSKEPRMGEDGKFLGFIHSDTGLIGCG